MQNELQHHGVKGMKWGVRRYQPYLGGKTGKFLGKKPKINKSTKNPKHAPASSMSDQELRQRINRIQMEQQYSALTARQKTSGEKFVGGIMKEIGREMVKDMIKTSVKAGAKELQKMMRER